jgi:hypothetical protein
MEDKHKNRTKWWIEANMDNYLKGRLASELISAAPLSLKGGQLQQWEEDFRLLIHGSWGTFVYLRKDMSL